MVMERQTTPNHSQPMPDPKAGPEEQGGPDSGAGLRPPVRPGQEVEITLTGLNHAGQGVGRVQGLAVFVDQALPGETVQARVLTVHRNYATARLERILAPAPGRQKPVCSLFPACGGCQLQHLRYAEQLAWKRRQVVDALERIGGLRQVPVLPTLGMADPFHYRNKVQYPVALVPPAQAGRGPAVALGCFEARSHRVVPADHCYIQSPLNNEVAAAVRSLLTRYGWQPYDERSRRGLIRHVLIRSNSSGDQALVCLVTTRPDVPRKEQLAAELMEAAPPVVGVVQNINPQPGNVILGRQTVPIRGCDRLVDQLQVPGAGKLSFYVSAASFFQVNPVQAEVLYGQVLRAAGLSGSETVVDAYAGVGAITLALARQARFAYGVEVVPAAVEDARANARLNRVENVEFRTGAVEDVLPTLQQEGVRAAVAVVDPPRAGCSPPVLQALAALGAQRLVYVSCYPATLARDLARLAQLGYAAVQVQPVDMFPQTSHVEAVALVVRQQAQKGQRRDCP